MINKTGQIAKMRTVAEQVDELEQELEVFSIRDKRVHLNCKKFFELFGDCSYEVTYKPTSNQFETIYRESVIIDNIEFLALIAPYDDSIEKASN